MEWAAGSGSSVAGRTRVSGGSREEKRMENEGRRRKAPGRGLFIRYFRREFTSVKKLMCV